MKRYVIESRHQDGSLDFAEPQPESVFGDRAITGITDDAMAKAIYARQPEAILDGRFIPDWPALIDPRWKAREKTW